MYLRYSAICPLPVDPAFGPSVMARGFPSPPTVIYPPLSLPTLLNRILTHQAGPAFITTTLVVCSTRHAFLQRLLSHLEQPEGGGQSDEQGRITLEHLIIPTLRNLATARHVHVTYCASVQALLAYLSTYSGAAEEEAASHPSMTNERVVLVNPLALHAGTVSYSAQGLSRTFAAAVEAATRLDVSLVLAECDQIPTTGESSQQEDDMDVITQRNEELPHTDSNVHLVSDPWEQEVSVLSASMNKFGSGSERPWAGRTVKVKRIAARWFEFQGWKDTGNRGAQNS
ncbi:unnamed protein product [Periconia digitata]|uniref:Uncharacterized protein n=1 Tax=Periconia digitata TaxID=1303443 RepID=A0A9W4U5R0_9PLEO|nr:unnamed protein product [Periconia digitata]